MKKNQNSLAIFENFKIRRVYDEEAGDGKKYLTDVANVETLLRLVQSVPSKKAEPIKLWLAKDARVALENKTGKSVITEENFLEPNKQKERLK
jgi:hypothetical protein